MTTSKKDEPMIEVKNISKQYNIGVDKTYKTLSGSLTSAIRNPLKALKDTCMPNNTFWALKDVNFKVERGEVIGIIGRNGAGKSTLLKILSRITYPTEGEIRMRGRVGSLLEVGTGFHPELSGRDNIYFNGAVLGMKKRIIDERFDEIVKFSGVEKFLDTPVKRYSSGMQVRLAFSVAAHLEPEILIVDEVLSVGDAAFQKKCRGKMSEVVEGGRTVLFVSHNMVAVRELCQKVILLESGRIAFEGTSTDAISNYLAKPVNKQENAKKSSSNVKILDEFFNGASQTEFGIEVAPDTTLICGLEIQIRKVPDKMWINLEISSIDGINLVHIRNDFDDIQLRFGLGTARVEIEISDLPLLPDSYTLRFRVVSEYGGQLEIEDSREFPLLVHGLKGGQGNFQAFIRTKHSWRLVITSDIIKV